jgi:hypothetical protein
MCVFLKLFVHVKPISAHSLISDSKRHHNSQLKFFFLIDALAHLGPFSYFGFETTSQLSIEKFFF